MDKMLERLCASRFRIFPVHKNSKIPCFSGWQQKATWEKDQITKWLKEFTECKWGLVCGEGLVVIDVDAYKGGSAPDWCNETSTFTVETQRGGQHFYFKYDSKNQKPILNSQSKIGQYIDVKGRGGYVVCPPSAGYTVKVNEKVLYDFMVFGGATQPH